MTSTAADLPPDAAKATSSFFSEASGTNASHSNFNAVGRDQHNTFIYGTEEGDKLLATLRPVDRRGYYVLPCMEGTRQGVLEMIDQWLSSVDEPNILWLVGSPGAGKSTIASSLVSRLTDRGLLGSSFFFKRGHASLSDPTVVWRTVAHDLARNNEIFAKNLVDVLKGRSVDPERADIIQHFKRLIKEPLIRSFPHTAPIIVIDALDECGSEGSQGGQRGLFIDTITQWSSLPPRFRLVVTGRNDRVPDTFRKTCKEISLTTGSVVDENTTADIRHFFKTRLAAFGSCLGPDLLGEWVLDTLTTRAAGLFIWAETVFRFMNEGMYEDRLKRVLNGDMGGGGDITKLYQQILKLAFPQSDGPTLETFHEVVTAVIFAKLPFREADLSHFISVSPSSVAFILSKLSSVISSGEDKRLRVSHLSFREFLCDPDRCPKEFCINSGGGSQKLSMACFRVMRGGLRFNICDLETSHLPNDEVPDLPQRIEKNISAPLIYSCRFWGAHLVDTPINQDSQDIFRNEVKEFFYIRFLFWLEVMSLNKEVASANISLLVAAHRIQVSASRIIITFLL